MAASKEEVAKRILAGSSLAIHLDPRRRGVVVPKQFVAHPALVLSVGWATAVPIPDLSVDGRGVSGTLSFSGAPFFCEIPWQSVFGLVDPQGKGTHWPEDTPPDLPKPAPAAKHEEACSMCARTRVEVAYLVAAERVSICSVCVVAIHEKRTLIERVRRLFFAESVAKGTPSKAKDPYRDPSPTACHFCGDEHTHMTRGIDARICRPCVILSRDILREAGVNVSG